MKFYCRSTLWLALLLTSLVAKGQFGQNPQQEERELPPVTRTYVITNAVVTQGPGRNIGRANVIIKDGLIQAVGKNVSIPPDAVTIKGDSLYVYAGFIDGLSRVGIAKPKEDSQPRERAKDPANPTPEQAGITPFNDVRMLVNPSEKSIEEYRALGFTTAQIVPYGGMLPGTTSTILLGGKTSENMIMASRTGLYSELAPAQRVYPNTVIAVMAKWRELYRQALQANEYDKLYASNRSGLARPATDRVTEAFYPVINKQMPVIFEADKYLDVQRVLALKNEFGFNAMLVDLKEGSDAIPAIKAAGTKVFLSLDLPEDKKFDAKKDSGKKEGEKKDAGLNQSKESKPDPEKEALEKRKEEAIRMATMQALEFQKAGVPFGFSTLSVKSTDVHKNLRRMIAAGLTEDQALAALTTTPAQLLGLSDRLGSIDPGKIANLVLSDKPYFNEKSKVRYVFVEGLMYRFDPKEALKTDATMDISGSWTVSTEGAQTKDQDVVTFKKEGKSFSGSITGPRFQQAANLESVELTGNKLKYSYTTQAEGQSIKIDVEVTIEGDSFKGTSSGGGAASVNVTGKKNPNR